MKADLQDGCFSITINLSRSPHRLTGYPANNAVDESIKTYWSAATGDPGEWISTDLGENVTVRAIQINYADQDADLWENSRDIYHQYKLYSSKDGKKWSVLVDKSKNITDVPHDYIELSQPVEARYIKLENIHLPTGKFAISGLRVFGSGHGSKPDAVSQISLFCGLKRTNEVPG